MVNRNNISTNTLRRLFAHSGNCCAFEGCHSPIFEDDGTLTGECCHIEAYSPNGPRYNEQQTNDERNGYDNLMLMCARHHKIIDSQPEKFTVDKLKTFKNIHENEYKAQQLEATDAMLRQLHRDSDKYWSSLKLKETMDDTGMKMELGDNNIESLMKEITELYDDLEGSIDSMSESSERLQNDLRAECTKCGIDYSLFDKIPYYENSLINRDWETTHLSLPNHLSKIRIRYHQLYVKMLEKLMIYDQGYSNLLDKCKYELAMLHKSAYYTD